MNAVPPSTSLLFEGGACAFLFFDAAGRLVQANEAAARLLRLPAAPDFDFADLYPGDAKDAAATDLREALDAGVSVQEGIRLRADDTAFFAHVCTIGLPRNGGFLVVMRDIDDPEAVRRLLFDQMPAVVWTTDTDLRVTMMHGGMVPGMRERAAQHVGSTISEILGTPGHLVVERMHRTLEGESVQYSYDYEGVTYDVRVDPLRDPDGSIRGTVAVAFDVTARRQAEEALRRSREVLRELAARMNFIQENERKRVARDIHDEMGQRLTALRLEVDLLRRELGAAGADRLTSMRQLIVEAGDAVRRIASELRPSVLDDFGLLAAIELDLAALHRRTGIETALSFPERQPDLHPDAMTQLYRIVQEALTNVARHSGATRVTITLTADERVAELVIADNGRGIAPGHEENGIGLIGVRERALSLGGELILAVDHGTRLTVRIPVRPPPELL